MRLLRPLPWALVALGVALAPLRASPGDDGPFGRPWYLGAGLLVAAALGATLLLTRTAGFRGPAGSRRRGVAFVGVLLVSYLAFVSNGAYLGSGDCLPQRAVPLALLAGDGLDLAGVVPREFRDHYSFARRDGRLLSAYPLGTGLLAVPYYAAVRATSERDDKEIFRDLRLDKHLAALFATLSVALFFAATRRWLRFRHRLAGALVLALATQWLPTAGQALWTVTGAAVLGAASLALAAARDPSRRATTASGVAMALALLARPGAVSWLPLAYGGAPGDRPRRLAFAAAFVATAVGVGAFHLAVYGNPIGGYARIQAEVASRDAEPALVRLAGVVASPSRGLLWFFPALAVAAPLALSGRRSPRVRRVAIGAISSVAAVVLVNAAWPAWWGGHGMGPRLLAELSIPFAVLAALALARVDRPFARGAVVSLLVAQTIVGFALAHSANARLWNREALVGRPPHPALWSLRDSQVVAALWPGWTFRGGSGYLRAVLDRSWIPLDLAPAANAGYAAAPAEGIAPLDLARLAEAVESRTNPGAFRFLPPDGDSVVRVCAGERSAPIAMPRGAARRLATVVLWTPRARPPAGAPVAAFHLARIGTAGARLPLRAGRELIAATPAQRAGPPARGRLAGGEPGDPDALVVQRFLIPPRSRDARTVTLEVAPDPSVGCVYWLAAAAAPARPRRAATRAAAATASATPSAPRVHSSRAWEP